MPRSTKNRPMTTITVELSDELYAPLKAASKRENRSVEEIARVAIERNVAEEPIASRPLTREEEMRLVREAMPNSVWSQEEIDRLFDGLGLIPMTLEEAQRIVDAIPPLD